MASFVADPNDIETYRDNTVEEIETFCSYLKEVQLGPTMPGKICDMDSQQFAASMVFHIIFSQEEYAAGKWEKTSPFSTAEHKKLLACMVESAKLVFGEEEYARWYESRKSRE